MKVAMVGFEALTVWAILQLLATRALPATHVLLYAWHPLPLWEFARSGHVDAVAIALLMLAFVAADRRSPVMAGIALGAGTLVKYFPVGGGPEPLPAMGLAFAGRLHGDRCGSLFAVPRRRHEGASAFSDSTLRKSASSKARAFSSGCCSAPWSPLPSNASGILFPGRGPRHDRLGRLPGVARSASPGPTFGPR